MPAVWQRILDTLAETGSSCRRYASPTAARPRRRPAARGDRQGLPATPGSASSTDRQRRATWPRSGNDFRASPTVVASRARRRRSRRRRRRRAVVRGPLLFDGYFGDPKATARRWSAAGTAPVTWSRSTRRAISHRRPGERRDPHRRRVVVPARSNGPRRPSRYRPTWRLSASPTGIGARSSAPPLWARGLGVGLPTVDESYGPIAEAGGLAFKHPRRLGCSSPLHPSAPRATNQHPASSVIVRAQLVKMEES